MLRRVPPGPQLIGGQKVPRTICGCLVALGVPRERVYVSTRQRYDLRAPGQTRAMSLWAREAENLDAFAQQAKRAFHQRLREIRTDLPENHEAALWIIAVYRRTQQLFRDHGVHM